VPQFTDPLHLLLQQKQLSLTPHTSGEPDSVRTHRIKEVGVEKWWSGAIGEGRHEAGKRARAVDEEPVDRGGCACHGIHQGQDLVVPQNPSTYVPPPLDLSYVSKICVNVY
jgi:hypothetical protein